MNRRDALDEFLARVRHLPRQELLDSAAVEILDAFDGTGVHSLLLKGPALARTLYLPEENRGYGDIDLLVRERNLPAAGQVLRELGYRNVSEARGIDDVAGVVHSEEWLRPHPNRREPPVMVDLHWRLAGCRAASEVTWEALRARRGAIRIGTRDVSVLARDGLAFHVAIHAAQHGSHDLKAIGDLTRALDRWEGDVWREASRIADEVEGSAAFAAGLRMTPAGARLADQLGLSPSRGLEWEIHNRRGRPRGTFHLQEFARARSVRERMTLLRRALIPSPNWIRWQYPWVREHRGLLLVAYGAHVMRAPFWAGRATLYERRRRRARGRAG